MARDTVGGKAHWTREVGEVTYHLYAISVPHDGFAIGTDLRSPWGSVALSRCAAARAHPRHIHTRFAKIIGASVSKATMRPNPRSHILECETYEDRPGWGTNTWKEECAADGGAQQDRPLTLRPGFTDSDCEEGLTLLISDLTEVCSGGDPFEALLVAGTGPAECGFDCAHLWSGYASGCGTFLGRVYPGFEAFR